MADTPVDVTQEAKVEPIVENNDQANKQTVNTDLDTFAENFDPNKKREVETKAELTPEQQAEIDKWKENLWEWTTVLDEWLREQIEKWATVKELLEWKSWVEQQKILQQLGMLNEDAKIADPNKAAAEEELKKTDNDSLVKNNDSEEWSDKKNIDMEGLKKILAKSKEGSIFDKDKDKTNPDDKATETDPNENNQELETLKSEKTELEEKVKALWEARAEWMEEKQSLVQKEEQLNFELTKEKALREKYEGVVKDYQTNTDLVSINDPFIRQLNESIWVQKESPSRENTLEMLYKINDVIKNVSWGLDISESIKEYEKVTNQTKEEKIPVNEYNYETAKNRSEKDKSSNEDSKDNIIPKGPLGRSV